MIIVPSAPSIIIGLRRPPSRRSEITPPSMLPATAPMNGADARKPIFTEAKPFTVTRYVGIHEMKMLLMPIMQP